MVNVAHSTLTGANLHEPKGAAAASADTVYVANGAGSGTWQQVDPEASLESSGAAGATDVLASDGASAIEFRTVNNLNKITFTAYIADISTAGNYYVVCPIAGDISAIYSVIDAALGTTNCQLTFFIAGVGVTDSTITITQAGSAAGNVDSAVPTAQKTLTAGQAIRITSDGASTNTVPVRITFVVDVS